MSRRKQQKPEKVIERYEETICRSDSCQNNLKVKSSNFSIDAITNCRSKPIMLRQSFDAKYAKIVKNYQQKSIAMADLAKTNGKNNSTKNGDSNKSVERKRKGSEIEKIAPLLNKYGVGQSETEVLDLSIKKGTNLIGKLNSLVTHVGQSPNSLFINNNKEESKNEDSSSVFTCIQCNDKFQTMNQLTIHMEKTMHYPQLFNPLIASGKTAAAIQKQGNNFDIFANPFNMGLNVFNYSSLPSMSYKCLICGAKTKSPIEKHMKGSHNLDNIMQWMNSFTMVPSSD